jgi:hypothetical protein
MNPGVNSGQVTVPGDLVRYLRKGVKREFGASLVILGIEVETTVDPTTYHDALARFDAARTLLETIGLADDPRQPALELDLGHWGRLILKSLESVHAAELVRLQDAAADGFEVPLRDVPALGSLVADIRSKTGIPSRGRRRRLLPLWERKAREGRRRWSDGR